MLRRLFWTPYQTEPILAGLLTLFVIFGLFMVYSSTSILSFERYGSDTFFVTRHITHLGVGLLLAGLFMRIKFSWLQKHAYVLFGFSGLLLITTLIPGLGVTLGGANRWITLGGMSIQPSELCKITFLLYLATSLTRKIERETLQIFSIGVLPHVGVAAVLCGILIFQPDFGNAVVFLALMGFILYIAGVKFQHLLYLLLAITPVAITEVTRTAYRLKRVLTFLNPWADPMNQGFQIIQSLVSFSSGELLGKGLGNSQGKLFFIPESHSDFVFAIMGEELGFVGIFVFLVLWCCFLFRGFKIASACQNPFSFLVASGSVFLLTVQSLIHMMVNLSLLPAKGMNLPFISTGGSNLMLCLVLTGILLNCAIQNKSAGVSPP